MFQTILLSGYGIGAVILTLGNVLFFTNIFSRNFLTQTATKCTKRYHNSGFQEIAKCFFCRKIVTIDDYNIGP
jgi:hypothetical protein